MIAVLNKKAHILGFHLKLWLCLVIERKISKFDMVAEFCCCCYFCIFFHTEKDSISRYMSDNKPICFIESYMYIMRRHTCSKNTVVGYEKHTIKFWHGCLLCSATCGFFKGLFSHWFRTDLTFDGVRCVSEMHIYNWLFFFEVHHRRSGWILERKRDEEMLSFFLVGSLFIKAFTFFHFWLPFFSTHFFDIRWN